MLLRRITKHVKEQNWFAVGIDFVIVVIGVFIGIQVANWNDGRAEVAEGARYIEQLSDEYVVIEETIEDQVDSYVEFSNAAQEALRLLTADIAPTSSELTPLIDVLMGGRIPPGEPAALRELISAGKLDLINQKELRTNLMLAQNDAEVMAQAFQLLRTDLLGANHALVKYMNFDLSADLTDPQYFIGSTALTSVDVEGLRNDPDAIVAVKTYLNSQLNMLGIQRLYLERIRSMNEALAAASAEQQ